MHMCSRNPDILPLQTRLKCKRKCFWEILYKMFVEDLSCFIRIKCTQHELNIQGINHFPHLYMYLVDLSLSVKAETLIFISGRGSATCFVFHLLNKGNRVLFIIW